MVFDLVPARIQGLGQPLGSARLLFIDGRGYAFVARGAEVRLAGEITGVLVGYDRKGNIYGFDDSWKRLRHNAWRATSELTRFTISGDEGTWEITAGGGCGCGSPLKKTSADNLLALVPA